MEAKGYINILSAENEEIIEQQQNTMDSFARGKGYDISEYFIDITSSTTDPHERQGFMHLMDSLTAEDKDEKEKAVFILNAGVLSRDAFKLLDTVDELKQNGARVFTVLEGRELTENDTREVIKDLSEKVQHYDKH